MVPIKNCIAVLPPVYELQFGFWRWCKLKEVCAIIPNLARITETDFSATPEELVSRFAALVRPNRIPEHVPQEKRETMQKKIFRYSEDGSSFWGTEVPIGHPAPPYVLFQLKIGTPYPEELFVPEVWAIDVLKAVRRGAVAAADFGETKIGFSSEKSGHNAIYLEGKRQMMLMKVPEGI